jgi:hypothetical protein
MGAHWRPYHPFRHNTSDPDGVGSQIWSRRTGVVLFASHFDTCIDGIGRRPDSDAKTLGRQFLLDVGIHGDGEIPALRPEVVALVMDYLLHVEQSTLSGLGWSGAQYSSMAACASWMPFVSPAAIRRRKVPRQLSICPMAPMLLGSAQTASSRGALSPPILPTFLGAIRAGTCVRGTHDALTRPTRHSCLRRPDPAEASADIRPPSSISHARDDSRRALRAVRLLLRVNVHHDPGDLASLRQRNNSVAP